MTRAGWWAAFSVALSMILVTGAALADPAGEVRTESFRLLNEGVTAYRDGDLTRAIEALSEAARMALNSFRAHYYLGLALNGDRRYDEAIGALTVALDLDPNHLNAHVAMGDSYLKTGDIGEAQAAYYRALKLRPEYPPALDGLARTAEAKAEDEEAIELYRRAIDSNRGYAQAYTNLGDLYLRTGRMEEAVHLLAEAVQIRPDFAPGLNRLARAYAELGLANEAVANIRRAIELQPASPEHRAALGKIHLTLGQLGNAEQAFEQALAIDPALPEARQGMAELSRRNGDYAAALEHLDAALEDPRLDRRTTEALEALETRIAAERDRFAELSGKVDSGEATPEDYRALARVWAGRGLWAHAIELQTRAPDTDEDREMLAYLLFRAGRFRESQAIYGELSAASRRTDLAVNNGVALALLGRDEQAVSAFDRALAIEPDHARAQLYKGNALLRLGRRDEAAQAYLAYLDSGGGGAAGERVRRILEFIAPGTLPEVQPLPDAPPPPPAAATEDRS